MHETPLGPVVAALSLLAVLAGCGGMPTNRTLESVHLPVVERSSYTLDVATGPGGLGLAEQQRLAGWFDALGLRGGDRVGLVDPLDDPATHQAVAALAARRGLLLGDTPALAGELAPGTAQVVVTRSIARVPGCPDWSAKSDTNLANATYPNYGCAVNANLAAMVADAEHLVRGAADEGRTATATATKAIASYREAPPTGERGLNPSSTLGGGAQTGGN